MKIDQPAFDIIARRLIKDRIRRQSIVKRFQSERSGREIYAIFAKSGTGIVLINAGETYASVFTTQHLNADRTGKLKPVVCDFCYTYIGGAAAARVSFTRETDKHIISWISCAELQCSANARLETETAQKSLRYLREDLTIEERCRRLSDHLQSIITTLDLKPVGIDE